MADHLIDQKVLERVLLGLACPICWETLKERQVDHIRICSCGTIRQNDKKRIEVMDWAFQAITKAAPRRGMSKDKRRKADRQVRMIQAACRQALNEVTPNDDLDRTIVHTDAFGTRTVERLTVRRDLHDAITEYGAVR